MPEPKTPSIHTLHDYDQTLAAMYTAVEKSQMPPLVTDPEVANKIGYELVSRLVNVDEQYEADVKDSQAGETNEDRINNLQGDLLRRDEGIREAASVVEFMHRKQAPEDFAGGERHYRTTKIDPAMQGRMDELRRRDDEQHLGKMIDELDPDRGSRGMMRGPLPEDKDKDN